jgi:hypothetical protein
MEEGINNCLFGSIQVIPRDRTKEPSLFGPVRPCSIPVIASIQPFFLPALLLLTDRSRPLPSRCKGSNKFRTGPNKLFALVRSQSLQGIEPIEQAEALGAYGLALKVPMPPLLKRSTSPRATRRVSHRRTLVVFFSSLQSMPMASATSRVVWHFSGSSSSTS